MSSIWFTSDLHLGHRLVAGFRGYGFTDHDGEERVNTLAHDMDILHSWEEHIAERDTVYVLGDLSSGNRLGENRALDLIRDLPGTKHLIAGNHDSIASIHRNGWRRVLIFDEVFTSVRDFARIRMRKRDVLLSHYPYLGPGADHPAEPVRYAQYRLQDHGTPLIHGHTHIADQRLHRGVPQWTGLVMPGEESAVQPGTPQVHVGWDAWKRPVRIDEIERLLFDGE